MKVHHNSLIATDRRLKLNCRMVDAEAMFQFVLQLRANFIPFAYHLILHDNVRT